MNLVFMPCRFPVLISTFTLQCNEFETVLKRYENNEIVGSYLAYIFEIFSMALSFLLIF